MNMNLFPCFDDICGVDGRQEKVKRYHKVKVTLSYL